MKMLGMVIMGMIVAALGFQFFKLYEQYAQLRRSADTLGQSTAALTSENQQLQADLEYFSRPSNLEKELRTRFNYKSPGENMIIVIPPQNSSQ